MAITLDEIVEEVSLLPDDVSAEVIERILIRRHGGFEAGVEEAWNNEISLRVREIQDGSVAGISLDQSFEKAARHLSR